jgi:membrane protein
VEPTREQPPQESPTPETREGRVRLRTAALRERGRLVAERAQAERELHASVDAVFDMADRDAEVGGGIIAGALAYRLFIWLLPLALVAVAGLGIAAEASSRSPQDAADTLGFGGLVSSSIAGAARSSSRWYALLIGVPVLVWATRSVLRALIGAHRLVWTDLRAAAPRPTLVRSLTLLLLLLGFWLVSVLASTVRGWAPGPGVLVTVLAAVPYAALWLLVSLRLPHRSARWTDLLPGAVVFGVGLELLNVVVAYVITPYSLAKQGTYGALGIAAGLLIALYLISRLVVSSAVVNATLWERRRRPG